MSANPTQQQSAGPNTNTRKWDLFHNPYHFVPANKGGRIDDLCKTAFENRQLGHVTHDRYIENTHSGRVICRLTTETSFFVGDETPESEKATQERPGKPNPFEIDNKPAIPASSLRGLISNIAEAASNSALRVLENRYYSFRVGMRGRRGAGGNSHDYFNAISPEILPFNPQRNFISIAEQMFGFVEQNFNKDKSKNKGEQSKALASRLRFSHATFAHWADMKNTSGEYYLPPVTLKILDSPKPPSPALYFKKKDGSGGYISKQQLSPNNYYPQGRKIYLHQADKDKKSWASNPPWATIPQPNTPCRKKDRCQQKVKVRPVKDGTVFYFHIDFNNLSNLELGLLLYSLNPSGTFRHKIGMGKPIGLGTVHIEPVGLFTINRKERYSLKNNEDIFAQDRQRYHNGWLKDNDTSLWEALYLQEVNDYRKTCNPIDYDKLRNSFADRMDKNIKETLELLGNPDNVKHPVHYPQIKEMDIENENFKWFVKNDDRYNNNKQFLSPSELKLTELT